MFEKEVCDITCASRNCDAIVARNIVVAQQPCKYVAENDDLVFGDCGRRDKVRIAAQKAAERDMTCSGCRDRAKKNSQNLYENIGTRIAEQREHQQRRDDERWARAEAQNSFYGGHGYGVPPPGEQ